MVISKNQIKYIKSLKSPKFRQKYNNFVAEGEKNVIEILKSKRFKIEKLFIEADWFEENKSYLTLFGQDYEVVNKKEMEKISFMPSVSSLFLIALKRDEVFNFDVINDGYSFYLDGVQDPGNVGTIIRIADWFGMKNVIRSEDSADFYNPKVIQSTMGSICSIGLFTVPRNEIKKLKGQVKLVSMDMHGDEINDFTFSQPAMIVLGNEGKGVSLELERLMDHTIKIKGSKIKVAESLNVGVAAGIVASRL